MATKRHVDGGRRLRVGRNENNVGETKQCDYIEEQHHHPAIIRNRPVVLIALQEGGGNDRLLFRYDNVRHGIKRMKRANKNQTQGQRSVARRRSAAMRAMTEMASSPRKVCSLLAAIC